jgi:flagellar hook-associated protein 2
LLNGTEGTRLILTSSKTGADHAIEVTASGGDGGLAALGYDPQGTMNLVQRQSAANARVMISGFPVESETNVIDDAIEGVTINLLKAEDGATFSLNVAFDPASVTGRIQAFIAEFNNLRGQLTRLGSYNAESQTAGPLLGDSLLRSVEEELRRGISDPVAGLTSDYTALASIGIKTTGSGTLELDATKLNAALAADPNAVAKLFGGDNGVAERLFERVDARLATGGDLELRNTRLKGELDEIARDKEALELRMAQIEARYRKQFTALDSLLAQMQSTSSYLAQQLANLPKIGS